MVNSSKDNFEFVEFKRLFGVSIGAQISVITVLYIMMTFGYYLSVELTGKIDGYSPSVSFLFVPIYEELIFRGIVLRFFERLYGFWQALVFSSLLFALWHFKNIFWLEPTAVLHQMTYTGFLFGPITAWITLKTRSLWPAVAIHYLNNMPYDSLLTVFK